jgi:hypothetical protein
MGKHVLKIFSETTGTSCQVHIKGLQNSLNVLSNFCSSWKLDVNQEKLKAIVFNSNGKTTLIVLT